MIQEQRSGVRLRAMAWVLCALLVFQIGQLLVRFSDYCAAALRYRFQLDYGEGVVWQQALLILTPAAYGPIDRFPAAPFEYTPLFHLVTRATVALTGADYLWVGRAVSLSAALALSILVGVLGSRAVRPGATRGPAAFAAMIGAFSFLCSAAVSRFAPLMRVDMLAVLLAMVGFSIAMLSVRRTKLIVLAALFFVGAVYTKQNTIAAPTAAFALLFLIRPRTATAGLAVCVATGGLIMAYLVQRTHGGVLLHLFRYNMNVVTPTQVRLLGFVLVTHAALIAIAVLAFWPRLDSRAQGATESRLARWRSQTLASPVSTLRAGLLAYAVTTTAMLSGIAKTGAGVNYATEWTAVLCVASVVALAKSFEFFAAKESRLASKPLMILPLLLLTLHTTSRPALGTAHLIPDGESIALEELTNRVRASAKPVVSDEMVLVLRAGKQIDIETALFTDLAKQGLWDERPYLDRIQRHEYSMFIVESDRGSAEFDARYSPAVADAIEQAYPIRHRMGHYVVLEPRSGSPSDSTPALPLHR